MSKNEGRCPVRVVAGLTRGQARVELERQIDLARAHMAVSLGMPVLTTIEAKGYRVVPELVIAMLHKFIAASWPEHLEVVGAGGAQCERPQGHDGDHACPEAVLRRSEELRGERLQ